jgi:Flp pilus assembly pilin Flp
VTRTFARLADRLDHRTDDPLSSSDLSGIASTPWACSTWWGEVNDLTKLSTLVKREEGQTMAEYGVVLAVITLGVVVALTALSGGISAAINNVVGFL